MASFENQIVVVTGGSRGIGAGLVRSFAEAGATVYFTYCQNQEAAVPLINDLAPLPVFGYLVDNRDPSSIGQFARMIQKKHNQLHVLVNNAGIVVNPYLYDKPDPGHLSFEDSIDVNLNGVQRFCTALFELLKNANGSVIINMSSMSADRPMLGMSAYSASKAAIESLSRVLAVEYAPYHIRVNCVSPGLVDTDIAQHMHEYIRENIIQRTPLKRLGTIDDITYAVLFLSHPRHASFITGAKLELTGGKHLD